MFTVFKNHMRTGLFVLFVMMIAGCVNPSSRSLEYPGEVLSAEKAFEQMCADRSIAEAFEFFAAENAVIKRPGRSGQDSLIRGKSAIAAFYKRPEYAGARVNWNPEFISVSKDGSTAWTYGEYTWLFPGANGDTSRYQGIFHTVWERNPAGEWKYVWD